MSQITGEPRDPEEEMKCLDFKHPGRELKITHYISLAQFKLQKCIPDKFPCLPFNVLHRLTSQTINPTCVSFLSFLHPVTQHSADMILFILKITSSKRRFGTGKKSNSLNCIGLKCKGKSKVGCALMKL